MIKYDEDEDTFFIKSQTGLNIKDTNIGIIFDEKNKLIMNYGLGFAVEKKYKELCKIAETDPVINNIIEDYRCFIFPKENKQEQLETLEIITNSKEKSEAFIDDVIEKIK